MRAGLLSQPEVIDEVNHRFISTTILVDDATKLAAGGNALARTITDNWEYPVDLMFLSPDGKLMSKLNSFRDFNDIHPSVHMPPKATVAGAPSKVKVFLDHVTRYPAKNRPSS